MEKTGPHIVSAIGAALTCFSFIVPRRLCAAKALSVPLSCRLDVSAVPTSAIIFQFKFGAVEKRKDFCCFLVLAVPKFFFIIFVIKINSQSKLV